MSMVKSTGRLAVGAGGQRTCSRCTHVLKALARIYMEQWWSGPPGEGGGAEASLGSLCILNDELWGLQMVRLSGKGRKTGYG